LLIFNSASPSKEKKGMTSFFAGIETPQITILDIGASFVPGQQHQFADLVDSGQARLVGFEPIASLSEILCLRHTIPPKELHAPHYNQVRCQRQIGTAANFSQAT
jgi:hypothetical protein